MEVTKFNSTKRVKINIARYKIDWLGSSASKFQTQIKQFFYPFWKNYVVLEEFRIPSSLLRCDLLCLSTMVAVEANGAQHDKFVPFFHNSRGSYLKSIKRDVQKIEWLENEGFTVIELIEEDIPKLSAKFIKEKFGVEI